MSRGPETSNISTSKTYASSSWIMRLHNPKKVTWIRWIVDTFCVCLNGAVKVLLVGGASVFNAVCDVWVVNPLAKAQRNFYWSFLSSSHTLVKCVHTIITYCAILLACNGCLDTGTGLFGFSKPVFEMVHTKHAKHLQTWLVGVHHGFVDVCCLFLEISINYDIFTHNINVNWYNACLYQFIPLSITVFE